MMRATLLSLFVAAFFAATVSAAAQDAGDLARRQELAAKMHEINPMNVQIEGAVREISLRYPEDKRELFVSRILQIFDQKALTGISVQAMAETFTAAELEKMIDFYGSAEGRSIQQKSAVYQAIIEPELAKRIDAALMELRTGAATPVTSPATP